MEYFTDEWTLAGKPGTRSIFLAEGESEVGFLEAYLSSLGTPKAEATIFCFKGVSRLRGKSATIYKLLQSQPETLANVAGVGLFADADDNPDGRVDTAIECAKAFGFDKGGQSLKTTGRFEGDGKRFGICLSPSNVTKGNIETLVLSEAAGTVQMQCLSGALDCLATESNRPVSSKAAAQMYVSALANSSMAGIGRAFRAGHLDVAHDAYSQHRTTVKFVLGLAP